ncbi:hypothetical protein RI578_42320 (plasmid) [Streptomyces sp. BB1-1-1]|uniref:hypothetical protein n=1 Tax=Streptomyces sp. BB1-1-1 TaxID=3074430 RepID=UPI002877CE50|nr:hypothetical protein [Streptomyces sp. BB1-1-1]WND32851.1 hypothetical protein RI578_00315 [Streptomyces sp. BB1-1-1]WND40081.1 hypothetical protein RI578_40090 [Streptomyces sp. BB1-1-1]WND40915.1 hypothetical protein RI578_42320 [Streptomyces sp. BB1-1-1]
MADRLVACMDEALFAAATPGDLLITRRAIDKAHLRALEAAGFGCVHRYVGDVDGAADVEHQLLENPGLLRAISEYRRLSPYAILPATAELARLTGHANAVPCEDDVVQVNSKAWSSRLSVRHGLVGAGHVVSSTAELHTAVQSAADQGHPVILVKDTYGVAGRGTFEVTSDRRLARLSKHLRGQEERGLRVELVVQPRYDRVADFSTHFHLDRDGSWRLLGVQSLVNSGYRHEMSGPAPRALTSALRHPPHPDVLETVARELAAAGYFGPVCVDSMVLRSGTWVPVLEINARMSMGGLNLRLDERVREYGLRSHLWQENVAVPDGFAMDHFLRALRAEKLLYAGGSAPGVLPLVGGSLAASRGRLVCAVFCPPESFARLRIRTRAAASSAGVVLAGAA